MVTALQKYDNNYYRRLAMSADRQIDWQGDRGRLPDWQTDEQTDWEQYLQQHELSDSVNHFLT